MSPKKKWWIKKFGKGWWIGHGNLTLGDFFSTWERAYAEAVRQARIVEVELPKVRPFLQAADFRVTSGSAWTEFRGESSNDLVSIPSYDRHRVALHLLALHYHHERNQK